MADLRIVDAPEIPTEDITGKEKLPTGGNGNYSISLDSLADYTKTKKDLADNISVDGKVNGVRQELNTHIEDLLNPHQVTKGQIGLGNVDNTADADKPVSNSTQAAIISAVSPKADKTYVDNQLTLKANKADVYTKSETYTKQESSDLVNNNISTALTPVNTSLDLAKRGVANRYDSSLTYNSGERVILTNGDIVKSTIDGNTNDPNVNMTGWVKANSTSQIFDESGLNQQEWNDGVESIVDLLAIANPKNGSRVYVHGVRGGYFIFDQFKVSENDGGTVFNGWVRQNIRTARPEWWGAIADGYFDCTAAIQSCINYSKAYTALKPIWFGAGHIPIEFSTGAYRVTAQLDFNSFTGLKVYGAGTHATALFLDATNTSLLNFNAYLDIVFEDMSILSGHNSVDGFVMDETRTNTCFKYTSQNSGSFFVHNQLLIIGFKDIENSTTSTVNGDNHIHNDCVYYNFDAIWNNSCTQAVIWTYNRCKAYYGKDCFINPANTLVVNGGDWINYGTFLTAKTASAGSECVFNAMRFENYQNIDPLSNPKLLDIEGDRTLSFNNCTSFGGGSIAGKVTAKLVGIFNLKFSRCWFDGIWDIDVGASLGGVTSTIEFDGCEKIPTLNQILQSAQGNKPINLILNNHRVTETVNVNRGYKGVLPSASKGIANTPMSDSLFMEDVVGTTPSGNSINIFTLDPYILGVSSFDVSLWTNGVQPVKFEFYTNSGKTTKIAEVTSKVAQNQYQILSVGSSDFLANYNITEATNTIYVEMSASSSAGLCRAMIDVNLKQVN